MLFILTFFVVDALFGCTGMRLETEGHQFVHGRTLEFGRDLEIELLFVPKNTPFTGTTMNGAGLKTQSKYAAVGAMSLGMPLIMDGINEKGLAAGVFYFPTFAAYAPLTALNQTKALAPTDLCHYILTQFATIDEVKAGLLEIALVDTPLKEWGGVSPPFHYIVYEKSGRAIVIEPLEGILRVFDNPIGVLTNSPEFSWHLTNLRNYIHLAPMNAATKKIGSLELKPLGQGNGLVGIPGDFSPPARFVRATFFQESVLPVKSTDEAIFVLFHLLNQFDIPKGAVREKVGGETHYDYTSFTVARDPNSLRYYFRSYQDPAIKVVDLKGLQKKLSSVKRVPGEGKAEIQEINDLF